MDISVEQICQSRLVQQEGGIYTSLPGEARLLLSFSRQNLSLLRKIKKLRKSWIYGAVLKWRPKSESNRRRWICNPSTMLCISIA
jgi:hypothetical protein